MTINIKKAGLMAHIKDLVAPVDGQEAALKIKALIAYANGRFVVPYAVPVTYRNRKQTA